MCTIEDLTKINIGASGQIPVPRNRYRYTYVFISFPLYSLPMACGVYSFPSNNLRFGIWIGAWSIWVTKWAPL